jgi:hypothetical protein
MRTTIPDAGKPTYDEHITAKSAGPDSAEPAPVAPRWHRWLRVQAIPDIHGVYDFFQRVTLGGKPVTVLSWPSTRFHVFWPRPLKKLLPAFNHFAMLFALLGARRDRVAVVREFDNVWFLLLAPAFWLFRRRLVLNVNQNFTRPVGAGTRARALKVLARLGFRLLWLDGAPALPDIRPHFPRLEVCAPLFPALDRRSAASRMRTDEAFTVGLVGYFREDKGGVAQAVALALELSTIAGVRVAAGFWNQAQRSEFCAAAGAKVETCSTYEVADYHAFLGRCHAIVVLAERDAYYYRHSGILMDCIAHGTLPICPAYPLLESIVMRPVPVGAVYDEHESLRCVVLRLLAQYDRLRANFALHAAARTPEQVGAALEELLQPDRATRTGAAIALK